MEDLLEGVGDAVDSASEPVKRKVTEVLQLLIKAVKAKLVYPASSRLPAQFKEDLFATITSLLDEIDPLIYKVETDGILFQNLEAYRAQNKNENFAHVFFRDGIMNFQFKKGLQQDELELFVDIVAKMQRSASVEDDLATLLWESEFEHISYKLMDDILNIETFEYGVEISGAGAELSKPDIQKLYENEIDLNITDEDVAAASGKNSRKPTWPYNSVTERVADFVKKLTIYDDNEKAGISELIAADAAFEHKSYVINLLFEILSLETDNAGYQEALDMIAKVRDDFIKAGDFKSALAIFVRIKELEQAFKNLMDLKLDKIQGFIEDFAAQEKIKLIIDALNREKDVDHADVLQYLNLLPYQAILPLVASLGELQYYPARRTICKALVNLAANKIELLARGIEDPRWYVVRNVVMILGKISSPKAIGYFRKTIRHPDIRVRKETVVSAARLSNEETNDFLIMALTDIDERIQIMALKELAQNRVIKAYNQIERIVLDKNFKDRSADQIKEFLEALAQLGRQRAFEILKKMSTQFVLVPSEKQQRLKNYAVQAMGYIRTQESLDLLDKIAKSRNHSLADTARRALSKKQKAN